MRNTDTYKLTAIGPSGKLFIRVRPMKRSQAIQWARDVRDFLPPSLKDTVKLYYHKGARI